MESTDNRFTSSAVPEKYMIILRKSVEDKVSFVIRTSHDFELLSETIAASGAGYLSSSTLKRIWGYVKSSAGRHTATLDILAQFVGHSGGFAEFMKSCDQLTESESGFCSGRVLQAASLSIGSRVCLSWIPDRMLVLRCIAPCTFEVEKAVNTKLSVDAHVYCAKFVEGKPLLLDVTIGNGRKPLIYEVGRQHGITWQLLP